MFFLTHMLSSLIRFQSINIQTLTVVFGLLGILPCMAQNGAPQSLTSAPTTTPVASAVHSAVGQKQNSIVRVSSPDLSTSFSSLDWASLTPQQHLSLKPLDASWKSLSDAQKRKWLSMSASYPQMNPADQLKLHARMAQWAALSSRQREQARLNFAEVQKVSPDQKNEKWQAYQALSPEEKQKLAKSAQPKPPSTALAAQPVAPGKLNRLPLTGSTGPVKPLPPKQMASRPVPPRPQQLL
jgi:hypothetical protein